MCSKPVAEQGMRPVFSYLGSEDDHPEQVHCHITHTNEKTHEIINANLEKSAMYSGNIEGVGPRYCPSIEDKVVRFADKTSHQIFIEPEGLSTHEVYPNGISTSLPFSVQLDYVHSIRGFENAHITRAGYAIEYDFFDPRDLHATLETKFIGGLYFAGQINGTTGYEEAGAQGLIAGLNAARAVKGLPAWSPRRDEAYIGVLIDDLITRGTLEPYRMFTSRAEYRLLLREDNADLRLTEKGRELGLVDDYRWQCFNAKADAIEKNRESVSKWFIHAASDDARKIETEFEVQVQKDQQVLDLLRRPEIDCTGLQKIFPERFPVNDPVVLQQLETQIRYQGYIERQQDEIDRQSRYSETAIPQSFNYNNVSGLSSEVQQKLSEQRPDTVGQASRIPGVTPAAVSLLLVSLKKRLVWRLFSAGKDERSATTATSNPLSCCHLCDTVTGIAI